MLTKKQYELLMFIEVRLRESGVSPSFDEMKDALDLKSKSGIHRLITGLEERGFIRRLPHRARALEVLRLPENAEEAVVPAAPRRPAPPSALPPAGSPALLRPAPRPPANDTLSVPLLGKIAAGTPIEALRDPSHMVEVPGLLAGPGDHYALTVEGDSMVEAGILDGDTVIIRRCETAQNGDIVVALVDNAEATLKTFRRRSGQVDLIPANRTYEIRSFGADRVAVQGRLVGLLRSY
jgi:repressor LexA